MIRQRYFHRLIEKIGIVFLWGAAILLWGENALFAALSLVMMKDGRVLVGEIAPIDSVAVKPEARKKGESAPMEKIVIIDDQLRQTYVPKNEIMDIQPDDMGASLEIFKFHQPVYRSTTQSIASLGAFRSSVPFDAFGRRTLSIGGSPIIQGITEVSPRYIKVQGINIGLDMRLSPHTFPRSFLTELIKKEIDPKSLDDRLRIYLFYTQAELFEEAAAELEEIMKDFQDDAQNSERLETGLRMIRQMAASRLVDELKLRQRGGQHQKVQALLAAFNDDGVSFDKKQAIQKMIQSYDAEKAKRDKILEELNRLAGLLENPDHQAAVAPILEEIARELNFNTLDRFSEFLLSESDASLNEESRLAIGLSGWLAGNAGTETRLEIVLSMFRVRGLIRDYFLEKTPSGRNALWEKIRAEEASNPPKRVAEIIQRMQPPQGLPPEDPENPGLYRIEIPSYENGKTYRYAVQLPPEYDPNRKYPVMVTLHSERTTPELQIDWWAGSYKEYQVPDEGKGTADNKNAADDNKEIANEKGDDSDQNNQNNQNNSEKPASEQATKTVKERYGQGTRFGYIVIAPQWLQEGEERYEYSPAQSGAVLYSLRDAMRRFSIDSDRVFLSGHSAGADAVWDLGLAHPDLWAGIIPICGTAARYPLALRKNAQFVPVYAVYGELDGGRVAKSKNLFDDGMNRTHPFDMTCVIFRGRGNESFSDEIIRIFEWTQLKTRNFSPTEKRTVFSMRPWDNYFWQVELGDFPEKTMILPFNWEGKLSSNYFPARTEFIKWDNNSVKIVSMADNGRVWLSPENVDFDRRIEVFFNGKKISPANGMILPDLLTLLEDVRTRGDRQHPFWAVLNSNGDKTIKKNKKDEKHKKMKEDE